MNRRSFLAAVPVVAAARLIGKRTERQPRTPLGCEKRHRQIEAKAASRGGNSLVWCERCGLLYSTDTGWCLWEKHGRSIVWKRVADATPQEWSEWALLTPPAGKV